MRKEEAPDDFDARASSTFPLERDGGGTITTAQLPLDAE
jgi:hypothetical protein